MKQDNKWWFITGQLFMGLGFALAGAIVSTLFIELYAVLTGKNAGLFGDIMGALVGCYIGMLGGVMLDGYLYLKKRGRQKEFLRFSVQSIAGLIGGIVVYLKIMLPAGRQIPYALVNTLLIVVPLAGAVAGFNFGRTGKKY